MEKAGKGKETFTEGPTCAKHLVQRIADGHRSPQSLCCTAVACQCYRQRARASEAEPLAPGDPDGRWRGQDRYLCPLACAVGACAHSPSASSQQSSLSAFHVSGAYPSGLPGCLASFGGPRWLPPSRRSRRSSGAGSACAFPKVRRTHSVFSVLRWLFSLDLKADGSRVGSSAGADGHSDRAWNHRQRSCRGE